MQVFCVLFRAIIFSMVYSLLIFNCSGLGEKCLGDCRWTLEEVMKNILVGTSFFFFFTILPLPAG
jgi:hypothetical protein